MNWTSKFSLSAPLLLLLITLTLTSGCPRRQKVSLPDRITAAEQEIHALRRESGALRTDLQGLKDEQQAIQEQVATSSTANPLETTSAAAEIPVIPLAAQQSFRPDPIQSDSSTRSTSRQRSSSKSSSMQKKHIRVDVSVREIQQCLQKAGCNPGGADGVVGSQTVSAIKTFQRNKGLTADGVVGTKTWAALKKYN